MHGGKIKINLELNNNEFYTPLQIKLNLALTQKHQRKTDPISSILHRSNMNSAWLAQSGKLYYDRDWFKFTSH
jgi:hypothetical protein